MRIAVLILGILAAGWCGFSAFLAYQTWALSQVVMDKMTTDMETLTKQGVYTEQQKKDYLTEREKFQRIVIVPIVLGLSTVLGLLGSILGMGRRRFGSGSLLLASGAAPAVLYPFLLIFTGPLLLPGLLALFISTSTNEPRRRDEDDDEPRRRRPRDEDDDEPRRRRPRDDIDN